MGISNISFSSATKFIPSRRSVACASAFVAVLAGSASLATAHTTSAKAAPGSATLVADVWSAGKQPAKSSAASAPAKAAAGAGSATHATAPAAKSAEQPSAAAAAAATVAAAPAPAKPANPYAGVTMAQLEPAGLYGSQEYFTATSEQSANVKTIVQVAERRGMSPYAAVIAVATAMQESSLRNLTTAVDADSLGLFQQRPSMGWGSKSQLTDPAYATGAFLSALTQYAPNYDRLPLWRAAQQTQRSGYPTAYARWEDQAARMVQQIAAAV